MAKRAANGNGEAAAASKRAKNKPAAAGAALDGGARDGLDVEVDLRAWEALPGHRTGTAGDRACVAWLKREILAATGRAADVDEFSFKRRTPGAAQGGAAGVRGQRRLLR